MARRESTHNVDYRTTKEENVASEVSWEFEMGTLAILFEALKSVGVEARHHLPKRETQRQYIICGVFSCEEINSKDQVNRQIEGFSRYLLQLCDDNQGLKRFDGKSIRKDRVAVLLNNFGRHGEARLFDPDGTLLRQIGVTSEPGEDDVTERHPYLDEMKKRFTKKFGAHTEPFIVLLSHLVPCTEKGHECARLIREYAVQTDTKIIVSYDERWQGTNTRLSLEQLNHGNIWVVKPKKRRDVVDKEVRDLQSALGSSGHLERLNSWENELWDDLDDLADSHVTDRKRRPTGKWPSLKKQPVPWDGKKKKRPYSRQNSKSEYARDFCR